MRFYVTVKGAAAVAGLSLLLAAPRAGWAQATPAPSAPLSGTNTATLTGTAVAAGVTAEPLPFATVLLRRASATDTSLVASGQTTLEGTFALPQVPAGQYQLRVQALGYQPLVRAVPVAARQATVALGQLPLRAASQKLAEVMVTGQRAAVQQELGKTVINVEKDLSSVGGTAVNVLQNVPSVAVDATGVVSLRGSSNLTILVDGKPSSISNGGTGPSLDQIPASQIAQIEVTTNPSARYDASGTGVINIITKKNQQPGWNGQLGLVVGTRAKYVPSLNLSHHHGPATWNLAYNGNDQLYRTRSYGSQTAELADGTRLYTTQTGAGTQHNRSHGLSLSLDYDLSAAQTLSLNVEPYWQRGAVRDDQVLTQQTEGSPTVLTQAGQKTTATEVSVLDVSADYRRTWPAHAGRKLLAHAGLVNIALNLPVSQLLTGGTQPAGFAQAQQVNNRLYIGKVDYTRPDAAGKGTFETGLQLRTQLLSGSIATRRPVAASPGELLLDPASSFDFRFTQLMPAAYLNYQRALAPNWSAQGGLRTEATVLSGDVPARSVALRTHYLNLFPSVTVAHELGKEAGQSRLQMSYARRLNRPDFMQQLPTQSYQDPRNYRQGNPALLPEFSHNLELGHQLNLANGASLTTTVFARFTEQAIQRIRTIDTLATRRSNVGVVTQETFQNLGNTTSMGLELSWAQALAQWWRVSATGSLYRSQIAANAANAANRAALAGSARLTSSFTPAKGLEVQLTGDIRSTVLTAQGRQLPTGGLDLALRQHLFRERATLTLRVSDVLNTQVRRTELATPELQTSLYNKYETRVAWLGFTWQLGASKPAKKMESAPGTGSFGG